MTNRSKLPDKQKQLNVHKESFEGVLILTIKSVIHSPKCSNHKAGYQVVDRRSSLPSFTLQIIIKRLQFGATSTI